GHPLGFRLPSLPASQEPTPWSSRVAPDGPRSPPAGPKLPPNHGAFQGSRRSLQAPRSFPQVSRSSLRVVPVFAGREVSTATHGGCTRGLRDYFQDSLAVHRLSTGLALLSTDASPLVHSISGFPPAPSTGEATG